MAIDGYPEAGGSISEAAFFGRSSVAVYATLRSRRGTP